MSLGWGLRGSIGGGSLGAMIPGAMIGLVLCLLLDRHSDSGLVAAFAAIGVGFGGQETYGQTVGLSLQAETFWWAIFGFVIKGAVWGLLGGAFIGIALDRQRDATAQLIAAFAIMVLGTWLGWLLVNSPKLIYFSNRLDKPREELWAARLADRHHGDLRGVLVGLSRLPNLCAAAAGLDAPRRHDRRHHGHRGSLSEAASDAPPGDLARRGQRLPLLPAAVRSRP
jgi:hypothetical protein